MTLLSKLCDWIGRRTNTIVMVPHPIVVGNCAEEILYGLLKARREGKKLALLHQFRLPGPLRYNLTNADLIDVDSPYKALSRGDFWFVVGSAFVTCYAAVFRAIHPFLRRLGYPFFSSNYYPPDDYYPQVGYWTLWQPHEVMPNFSWSVVASYDWPAQISQPIPVYLGADKLRFAEDERARMGLPSGAWFVCLHVRESGYHKDDMSERNASILNYLAAISEITSRGGWVVRLGDPTMTCLPLMERVIDYPFTSSKSYAMDLYLISNCRVYIGMQSGIFDIARLFHRPTILTNMVTWVFSTPQLKGDLGILKHIYSKSRRRFLSLREWLDEPFDSTSFREMGEDYVLHENSSEELRNVVVEFFDRPDPIEPSFLQIEFNAIRVARVKAFLDQPLGSVDSVLDQFNRYRIASRLESATGLIGARYLRDNWERDARESTISD